MKRATRPAIFKWRQAEPELILCTVRGYLLTPVQGDAFAQVNLGAMYADGRGVLRDSVIAHMWLNIADANRDPIAREGRDALERDMTRTQIRRATELARSCIRTKTENTRMIRTPGSRR